MKCYPCNQLYKDRMATTIKWVFASESDGIPGRAQVSLGSKDPMTGETISDTRVFLEYHRAVDLETIRNQKVAHPETEIQRKNKMNKKAEWEQIRTSFTLEYGYEPNEDTIRYLYEEKHPKPRLESLDYLFGENNLSSHAGADTYMPRDPDAEAAFSQEVPPEIEKLRAYVDGLNERQKEVYQAMLLKHSSAGIWIRDRELAEKWGVSTTAIVKERKRIIAGIVKAVKG